MNSSRSQTSFRAARSIVPGLLLFTAVASLLFSGSSALSFENDVAQDQSDSPVPLPSTAGSDSSEPGSPAAAVPQIEQEDAGDWTSENASEHHVQWMDSLEQAGEIAVQRRTPILLIFGAVWCGPCRELEKEIEHPVVQKQLELWVPVHIDVDKQPDVAARMAVSGIPAVRILTPDGRVVGQHEGLIKSADLAEWLSRQLETVRTESGSTPGKSKLNSITVRKVLQDLRSREATVRETAISRIVPLPQLAAPYVVTGFADASLSEQLALLDVLAAWDAPVDGIDPWIPSTITVERIQALEEWLKKKEFPKSSESAELSASDFIEASRLLRQMLSADAAGAAACREQLARIGTGILPLIREMMAESTDDETRSRLSMARYRVAASIDLVAQWPDGIMRLASADFKTRVSAVHELSSRVTVRDERLLAELVTDPAPLVREISLGALRRIGGTRLDGPLVKMLGDPDPNVRSAVLKHLAETKSIGLIPAISAYISTETDVDLVVHAVRGIREVKHANAAIALLPLTDHASWRVRAESVEGIIKYLATDTAKIPATVAKEISSRFLSRLDDEDGFVLSKLAEGIRHIISATDQDEAELLSALNRAVHRHPQLARVILSQAFSYLWTHQDFIAKLRELCRDDVATIRAAAIAQLVSGIHDGAWPDVEISLNDDDLSVRVATIDAMTGDLRRQILETVRTRITEIAAGTQPSETSEAKELPDSAELPDDSAPQQKKSGLLSIIGGLLSGSDAPAGDFGLSADSDASVTEVDPLQYTAEQSDTVFHKVITDRSLNFSVSQFEDLLLKRIQDDDPRNDTPQEDSPDNDGLRNETHSEKLAAAKFLSLLGDSNAFAIVLQSASARSRMESLAALLPALPWAQRQELFRQLLTTAASADDRAMLAQILAENLDPRSTLEIWNMLAEPNLTKSDAVLLLNPLKSSYPPGTQYQISDVTPQTKKLILQQAKQYAIQGTGAQQLIGLYMMAWCEDSEVADVAQTTLTDTSLTPELRTVALQFRLFNLEATAAAELGLSLLSDPEPKISETALKFLSLGQSGMTDVNDISARIARQVIRSGSEREQQPVILSVPEGLTAEQVIPFLQSARADVAASAAHLLALMKNPQGLSVVIDYWRTAPEDESAQKMLYQAISATNDPQYVPILEELYFQMSQAQWNPNMADFYWTIRTMTGPEVIALRKKIREEQGADRLR